MRLFFALWPPDELLEPLSRIAGREAIRLSGKATRRETIHLTLAFLGEQEAARLPEILAAARGVCAVPFEFRIDRLGGWRHQRLMWAGCESVPDELQSLAGRLRERLCRAGIAFDDKKRPFVPHLSLVRKLPERVFPLDLPPIESLPWRCDRFVLVESQLSQTGPAYRLLETFPVDSGVSASRAG